LLKNNGVFGLPTIPRKLKQCDACILGKHSKQHFHDSTPIACRKNGLIHSNLCGPILVPSANGNKYLMYFINDYTRMCWVCLLKDKSHDFETFKNFHVWIQNEDESHIGSLHNDKGREYASNEFEIYLRQHGIKHQTIVPYNPQHNGVVERMNMTFLNVVHCMMFFKNMKLMFWDDAILCEVYVKNKSPSHALWNNNSHEMWYGRIPLVRHLKVFGSTRYALRIKEASLMKGVKIEYSWGTQIPPGNIIFRMR
jgi:transposase InsO family protein